ncbi:hypothetical protein [Desulfobaculum bizertense]|uniref:Uncharacterized protein n=1 Tax=Desulfobaculum bizertense DSM 18034 TaxID=1121442 RepID=A0A1T4W8B1_9BACT|nr:hypothetical protein [Desulfobaculum bizertense]UIJ39185.1 hypothetical protein LWC08_06325 [Desulfobaculum bizertense]SKA73506.1 hypothetical protein SAMN02745702_01871 [Desulfobaculum bizertense DSM 18034]
MFFADDGYFESPGWYIAGSNASQNTAQTGLTPAENRFLLLTPVSILASNLFRASWGRKRNDNQQFALNIPSTSRRFIFTGQAFDQFDLDVLLNAIDHGHRQGNAEKAVARLDLKEMQYELGLRPGLKSRERITQSLQRLESSRILIENARYCMWMQCISSLLFDTHSKSCFLEIHPAVDAAFRDRLALRMFLRERDEIGARGMCKWLHGLAFASGNPCSISLDRIRRLANLSYPEKKFSERLEKALVFLWENSLLQKMEIRDNSLLLQSNRSLPNERQSFIFF